MTDQRLTPEERFEFGASLRDSVPLDWHADWSPDSSRESPVSLIEQQNENRLAWLVPERRTRMSRSAFTFYRGAARIMASDLAGTPTSGITTQVCGDAHLANFGGYASPERQLVLDLNDFDETLPGPWEWDVKRLAASLYIAGRHNGHSRKQARKATQRCVKAYRKAIAKFADMRLTDLWYDLIDAERLEHWVKGTRYHKEAKKRIRKAMQKDSRHALDRLAEEVDGRYQIRSEPPLLIPLRELSDSSTRDEMQSVVTEAFAGYQQSVSDDLKHLLSRFRIVDCALKVVGVGSVGTRCWILLLEGRDRRDPLFLQIKQASKSVLEDHLPPSHYENSAERVVKGQRLMQAANDIFLGWNTIEITGHQYYWRQLKDWKGSVNVDQLDKAGLTYIALARGWNLARAHARSGDAIAIAGYLGSGKTFDRAITEFSARYATQNEQDFDAYVAEIDSGRLEASSFG